MRRTNDLHSVDYRPRLLYRALESGCRTEDLSSAYNMSPDAIRKQAERYRRALELEAEGNRDAAGVGG